MVFEIAELDIKPGDEEAFEAAARMAVPLFQRAKGFLSFDLQRTIERPNIYRLVVGWATLEDHMVHFRESSDFQEWRRLVGPHFAAPPKVEHTHSLGLA